MSRLLVAALVLLVGAGVVNARYPPFRPADAVGTLREIMPNSGYWEDERGMLVAYPVLFNPHLWHGRDLPIPTEGGYLASTRPARPDLVLRNITISPHYDLWVRSDGQYGNSAGRVYSAHEIQMITLQRQRDFAAFQAWMASRDARFDISFEWWLWNFRRN